MKIKPLQWKTRANGTKFCNTPVNHYEIGEDGFISSPFVVQAPNYEEAINICNKNYYEKVNSMLIKIH